MRVSIPSFGKVSILLLALFLPRTTSAHDKTPAPQTQRFEWVEEWSIAAQGPVHLREKRVKATYLVERTDLGQSADKIEQVKLNFLEAMVEADVPAQRRSGRFDSRRAPDELMIKHHELIRPIVLLGQSITLQFRPDGTSTTVNGEEMLTRRLDDLYDEFLRGSEQDHNTREFERQRLRSEDFARMWRQHLFVSDADLEPNVVPRERTRNVDVTACIPSESWMRRVSLPVRESTTTTRLDNGRLRITKTAALAAAQKVETKIGDVAWVYEPRQLQSESTWIVRPDRYVEKLTSTVTAVLSTTISLGGDIPIEMTVRHATEWSPP